MSNTSTRFLPYLESLETQQLNLGLYTTRVTAEDLHRALIYEQLAQQRSVRVLHLEAGDVENDVFMEKVRTVTDDSHSTE